MTNAVVRLKSLDLQGYKTFASRAFFEFAPTVTAVVGPNGSGKSNIADALRWVLGEQSYSLLRGKKTEDMIYTGSESRPRASMASATITFDNADGWLPIDFTEVTITRRAYRDGQNEYLLNNQKVRLRQVSELLSEVGLAQRTYTIIGQGLVDAVLSLKAEERRRLFEEAAGIGLYRSRREEAVRRLDNTQRNLERVQDILAELKPRLRSLERQAKRAEEFEQVRGDLKDALRTWYGFHWGQVQRTVSASRSGAQALGIDREALRDQQEALEEGLAQAKARIDSLRAELHLISQRSSTFYSEREALGRRMAVASERQRWLGEQDRLLEAESVTLLEELPESIERLEKSREEEVRRRETQAALEAEWSALSALEGEDAAARQARLTLGEGLRTRMASLVEERAHLLARQSALDDRRMEQARRVETLGLERARVAEAARACESSAAAARAASQRSAERSQAAARAHSEGEQAWGGAQSAWEAHQSALAESRGKRAEAESRLQIARRSHQRLRPLDRLAASGEAGELPGWVGRLIGEWTVAPPWQRAIRAALGELIDSMAVRDEEDLHAALDWIGQGGRAGRMAFFAHGARRAAPRVTPPQDSGCLGNAADLIQIPLEERQAADLLLGDYLVVQDRQAARRVLGQIPPYGRVVTLRGEVFFPGGIVVAGEPPPPAVSEESLLAIAQEFESAQQNVEQAERRDNALAETLARLRDRLGELRQAADHAAGEERQARLRVDQTALEIQAIQREEEYLAAQHAGLTVELDQLLQERRETEARLADLQPELQVLEADLADLRLDLRPGEAEVRRSQMEERLALARTGGDEAQQRAFELAERVELLQRQERSLSSRREANRQLRDQTAQEVGEAERGMQEIEQRLSLIAGESGPAEAALTETERRRSELEARETRLRLDLQGTERRHSQAQIDLARHEQELLSLQQRIEDDFGLVSFDFEEGTTGQEPLPLQGIVEHLPQVDQLPLEMESQVGRLRLQLRRMGAVNLEAQREYLEVRERVEFLTSQVDDLRKAESQVREVIAELDHLMEREFRKTFEAVAVNFRQTFSRLFGGGTARLTLTDPDDLNATGIDIEARLPGRREQGLAMLSGGERSLTACALVFALLQVSPTPFCVLDEVDAMLDESNVVRFGDMLRELSRNTQFIVITHNRQTIQAAEVVYGVSMGADSASRVMGLRLDEAERQLGD